MNGPADHSPSRVAIVGGGLIGLFSAYYLARAGHHVTVLERSGIGSGAARGNGGWICPGRSDPLPAWEFVVTGMKSLLTRDGGFFLRPGAVPSVAGFLAGFVANSLPKRFARAWDEMDTLNITTLELTAELAERGIITDLHTAGFLQVYADRRSADLAHAGWTKTAERGISQPPHPVVERDDLLELEPSLGPRSRYGFLLEGDVWLDPNRLVDQLHTYLVEAGVEFTTSCNVLGFEEIGDRVRVITSSGHHEADHVVVATGAWAPELLRPLGVRSMVAPGKGYSFSIRPDVMPRHNLQIADTHIGVTPYDDHVRMVGIVEFDGTTDGLNPGRVAMMERAVDPYLTGYDWSTVSHEWAGPRPMTPDGKPLIGCLPGHERIVLATGHNMLGLSLGPATGAAVARCAAEGPSANPPGFSPTRFTGPWPLRRLREAAQTRLTPA